MMQKIGSVFRPRLFLYLIRALIPRWNFFDYTGYQFELELKLAEGANWQRVGFHQKTDIFGLFVNPDANMDMAQVNIIEHFAYDVQDLNLRTLKLRFKDVQRMTSFKLLKSLIDIKIQDYVNTSRTVQFKIVATNLKERRDIYISDWFDLGESL